MRRDGASGGQRTAGKGGGGRDKSIAPEEPLPRPGCPPHCRFALYYALFVDYAAAVVGGAVAAGRGLEAEAEVEGTVRPERDEDEDEDEDVWAWAAEAGEELHRCGSYGKGTLSRSQPTFDRTRPSSTTRHRGRTKLPMEDQGEGSLQEVNRAKRERDGFHRRRSDQPAPRPPKRPKVDLSQGTSVTHGGDDSAAPSPSAPRSGEALDDRGSCAGDASEQRHRGWWELSSTCPYMQMGDDERESLRLARTCDADATRHLDEPAAVTQMLLRAGFTRCRPAEEMQDDGASSRAETMTIESVAPAVTASSGAEGTTVPEFLQLGLEEAFYLVAELGCLKMLRLTRDQSRAEEEWRFMDASECWSAFCASQDGFAYTYAAYRYYRRHNWVVKSGLKFGTDFVLYRRGPAHYHAEWSVMVQACGEGVPGGQWSAGGRQLSWRNLGTLNRLSEQVAKGLLLCSVELNDRTTDECDDALWATTSTTTTSSRWSVDQVVYRRWVPAVGRE